MTYNARTYAAANVAWVKRNSVAHVGSAHQILTELLRGDLTPPNLGVAGSRLRSLAHAHGTQAMTTLPLGDLAGVSSFQRSIAYSWLSIEAFMAQFATGKAPSSRQRDYDFINGCALALCALRVFASEAQARRAESRFARAMARGLIARDSATPLLILVCWMLDRESPLVGVEHFREKKDYPSDTYFQIIDECRAGGPRPDAVARLLAEHATNTQETGDEGFQEFLASPWQECPVEVLLFRRMYGLACAPDPTGLMQPVWDGIRFDDLFAGDQLAMDFGRRFEVLLGGSS